MSLAVIAAVVADLLFSNGMKRVGDVTAVRSAQLFTLARKILSTPQIWLGSLFMSIFFGLWLAVLSWELLSVAFCLQAGIFVLTPLAAARFLGETNCKLRWLGICSIAIGVVLVAL